MNVPPNFLKGVGGGGGGVVDRISLFIAGKVGAVAFFKGGCSFDIKNKLKSEIFNDKKSL